MPSDQAARMSTIGALHEVRATFPNSDAMQAAIGRLRISGFDRADLSVPEANPPPHLNTPDAGAKPAHTEADARQLRTNLTGTAAAAASLAAAGIVVATGGAALPAVAAAAAAGGAVGGATYAASSAVADNEQSDRDEKAAAGTLILSARAPSPEKRAEAEAIMREAGATDIQVS